MLNNTKSLIASFTDNAIKNKTFIIPPYQRLYAWKDEQIKALLDDFKNCIEHNKNQKSHFIGNIVVSENDGKYILIDGQQRLTTIWLVLRYLLRKNFKAKDYFGIEMPIRKEDIKAIEDYCDNEKSLDECFNEKNNTNVGFKNAFKCFEVYFGKDGEGFIDFIKGKVKFNLVILGDQVELNKYFVRMNNTGVQLDGTDILKARLLKLISDYEENQNNTNKTSDCENKKSKDKTSKESKVTKYARIFDECSQMNYFSDFSKNYENTSGEVPTINNIIDNAKKIQNYSNNDNNRAEFESIIDFPTFVLHVFKILSRQESTKNYFKSQISIKKDKFLENTWDCLDFDNKSIKEKAKIAENIINNLKEYRTIFDTFVIKRKADDEENEYKLWNRFKKNGNKNDDWHEVDNTIDLKLIQNYLRVARRGDNNNYHHFLTNLLRYAKVNPNPNQIYLYLKNLDTALAYELLDKNNDNTLLSVAEEFQGESTEYNMSKISFNILNKGTNTPHYWFYRLEYYLLTTYKWNEKQAERIKKEFKFRYLNSVEHILARQEEHGVALQNQEFLDVFGNIALISKSENSSYSNQNFKKKQIDFNKHQLSSLKLLDVYSYENWDSDKIKDHQEKMLDILKNSFKN